VALAQAQLHAQGAPQEDGTHRQADEHEHEHEREDHGEQGRRRPRLGHGLGVGLLALFLDARRVAGQRLEVCDQVRRQGRLAPAEQAGGGGLSRRDGQARAAAIAPHGAELGHAGSPSRRGDLVARVQGRAVLLQGADDGAHGVEHLAHAVHRHLPAPPLGEQHAASLLQHARQQPATRNPGPGPQGQVGLVELPGERLQGLA